MPYPYRYSPHTEVSGSIMSALFNHYRREEVLESLEKHNLDYFEAERWYPVDQFINLLTEWATMPSFMTNLVSVGMAMIYHLDLPDEFEDLKTPEKLLKLGNLHMEQHQGNAGSFIAERRSLTQIRFIENTVWPDDLIYGYIYGAAKKFFPRETHFTLRYAANHQHQEMGGDSTILELDWE